MKSLDKKVHKNLVLEDLIADDDTFVEVKDIKRGDFVYEYDFSVGLNYEFQAITDAKPYENGWLCILRDKVGEEFEIYVSGGTKSMFLPNLYRKPIVG